MPKKPKLVASLRLASSNMPGRAPRHKVEAKTTILLKAGRVAVTETELYERVFWKSQLLARQALSFWHEVKNSEPSGLQEQVWKDWISKHHISVGQFYNMIHGMLGAGFLGKRDAHWHISKNFIREVEALLQLYSSDVKD